MANDPFGIVKDSSVWFSPKEFDVVSRKDPYIRTGIVQKVYQESNTMEIRYLVEVQDRNDKISANCQLLRRFGGVFNYEDFIDRGYKITDKPDPTKNWGAKAGDVVLVAFMNGQSRDGIILGGITHPARTGQLDIKDGPQYLSEFNGMETSINKDGEYTLTFKGQPTNLSQLLNVPSSELPDPTYDTDVGSSYWKFDKQGGWTVSDNAKQDHQSVVIDKANGAVTVTAGKVIFKFTKGSQDSTLTTKTLNINSSDSITETTKDYSMSASSTVKIKTPKVAIGSDSVELLEQLNQLITKLGAVQPISPLGPCTPLMATPQWTDVTQVQSKINQIKGTL